MKSLSFDVAIMIGSSAMVFLFFCLNRLSEVEWVEGECVILEELYERGGCVCFFRKIIKLGRKRQGECIL